MGNISDMFKLWKILIKNMQEASPRKKKQLKTSKVMNQIYILIQCISCNTVLNDVINVAGWCRK